MWDSKRQKNLLGQIVEYSLHCIDCKTVRIFAYSSMREQSNKRSGTGLKTESETGERRYAHALPISLLILRKKPDCFAVYALYKLRKKRARKTSVVQATPRSRFTLSRAMSHVWPVNTSNRTTHKLRKKLANQKRRHMSLGLCGIRTRYCALLRRRSMQDV